MEASKDELNRAEIVNQANLLFQRYGMDKTSVDEIAKACRKAKSTIYHYFASKDEIFEAVIFKEMASIYQLFLESLPKSCNATAKLKMFYRVFILETEKRMNINSVIRKEVSSKVGDLMFIKVLESMKAYMRSILDEGMASGEFKKIQEPQIDWFVEVFMSGLFGIVIYFVVGKNDATIADKLDTVSDLLFAGILSIE